MGPSIDALVSDADCGFECADDGGCSLSGVAGTRVMTTTEEEWGWMRMDRQKGCSHGDGGWGGGLFRGARTTERASDRSERARTRRPAPGQWRARA